MEKYCAVCGKSFEPVKIHQKYCCRKCRYHARYKANGEERATRESEIVQRYRAGESSEQLATAFALSQSRIAQMLRKHGEPTDCERKRSAKYKEIRDFVSAGHTRKEATAAFGCSIAVANKAAYGLPAVPHKRNEDTILKYIPAGFDYVGGYDSNDGSVSLRCQKCGAIFERSCISLRHNKNTICPACAETEKEQREQQKRIEYQEQRLARMKTRRENRAKSFWSQNFKQTSMKICAWCGDIFVGAGSCCSEACRKSRANHQHDRRLERAKAIDNSITLKKLYKRDNGVCWLCGGRCDYKDHTRTSEGYFVVGKMYPSIDHVLPLAKGGSHTWQNVRLAHFYCNTLKRDKVVTA